MRISDWSSDVCSSDLRHVLADDPAARPRRHGEKIAAVEGEAVGGDGGGPRQEAHQRQHRNRLAGARFPDDGDEVALVDLEVHAVDRSEEHTSELQSLMRISYAVFCLKTTKKKTE